MITEAMHMQYGCPLQIRRLEPLVKNDHELQT